MKGRTLKFTSLRPRTKSCLHEKCLPVKTPNLALPQVVEAIMGMTSVNQARIVRIQPRSGDLKRPY